jgi:hypothetical protein
MRLINNNRLGGVMTEFAETAMRHMCRNPKCRSRLPAPVSNEREAFCARGCHAAFYRRRCLVCEQPIERKTENQRICARRKCRSALRAASGFGRFHIPADVWHPGKKPANTGLESGGVVDRGIDWAIAVNSARIRAPRRVLDREFANVCLLDPEC